MYSAPLYFAPHYFLPSYFGGPAAAPQSVHWLCLLAVQAGIQSLALDGLTSVSIVVKKVALDRLLGTGEGIELPAIVLTPLRETLDRTAGVNLHDDVVYPVQVTIFDRDNQEPTHVANLPRYELWRQRVSRYFRQSRLTGVPTIINSWVEPGTDIDTEAWSRNLHVSQLTLHFVSREPRGLN